LWDTWLFPWDGKYHLFFLETQETTGDHVGHAVSDDLVHWQTLPSIRTKGSKGQWNEASTLTGAVIRHGGLFYLLVGSYCNDIEAYGLYTSKDLENWEPHPDNPVLRPEGPYYLDDPAKGLYVPIDWRDPCIFWMDEDQHYHAVICARRPGWSHVDTGAVIAHVRSKDLISWEHLPPLKAPTGKFFNTELPGIFKLDGRYYLIFSTSSIGGVKICTSSRDNITGTFYMIGSDIFDGPFTLPDDYVLVGSGHDYKYCPYSSKTIPYNGGRLLYHQISCEKPAWGAPKIIRARQDGTLWLEYFPGLEKLETGTICNSIDDITSCETQDMGHWNRKDGKIVGLAQVVGTVCEVAGEVSDLHLQCRISAPSAARAGVVLRGFQNKQGVAVLFDWKHQWIEIGPTKQYADACTGHNPTMGWNCITLDTCRYRLERDKSYHLRCFARSEFFDVYVDNQCVFSTAFPEAPKKGSVQLCLERGEAEFTDLQLAAIEPLA